MTVIPNLTEDIRRFLTTFDRYQDLASELLDAAYGLHRGENSHEVGVTEGALNSAR